MAYSNPWSNSITIDSTYLKDIDAAINRILVDVEQRMDTIIGNSNWSSGNDPVIDGTLVKSLVALKSQVDSIVTGATINATDNFIPKRQNSGAFINSLLKDNGAVVELTGSRPATCVKKTSFTISPGIINYDTEVYNEKSMWIGGSGSKITVPSNCGGFYLMFATINSVSTQFNGQQFHFLINGAVVGSTYVAQDAKSLCMMHLQQVNAAQYMEVNMASGSNISISDTHFTAVRLF
jgi:hypothetical protein